MTLPPDRGCVEDQPQRLANRDVWKYSDSFDHFRAAAGRGRHSRAPMKNPFSQDIGVSVKMPGVTSLDKYCFALQSIHVNPNWAAENIQVIRTLMERSSLYRRAMAPIMIVVGIIGVVSSVIPFFWPIKSNPGFSLFWLSSAVIALFSAFLLVRKQAVKEGEPFWSSPTRRIAQAITPAFVAGFVPVIFFSFPEFGSPKLIWILPPIWMLLYGCALHAAGFFMQRGIRLFGWIFVAAGCAVSICGLVFPQLQTMTAAHIVMGIFFGLAHLACGGYFYCTEKRKNAT